MSTLQRAIEIALEAHRGQVDKAGAMYVLHPLRVMLALPTEHTKIVGVLHDVVEDCEGWTLERLQAEGFSADVIDGIDAVTKRTDEHDDYFAFVKRAGQNPIGRLVKLADLRDNADLGRLGDPSSIDKERSERYRKAIDLLEAIA